MIWRSKSIRNGRKVDQQRHLNPLDDEISKLFEDLEPYDELLDVTG